LPCTNFLIFCSGFIRLMCHPSSSLGTASVGVPGLKLGEVEAALRQFYERGLASSTRKSYSSGQKHFLNFCSKFNLIPILHWNLLCCSLFQNLAWMVLL
jgi:hypothetical protein